MRVWRAAAALALGAASACLPSGLIRQSEAPVPGKVQVRYLGVGGFVIRRGADVLMTAPLYTNPKAEDVLVGKTLSDPAVIGAFVKAHQLEKDLADVRGIFSGHGHYDHLMDVADILGRAPQAVAVGSVSAKRTLAGFGSGIEHRVVALNDADPAKNWVDFTACRDVPRPEEVATDPSCVVPPSGAGRWWPLPGTAVRVHALCSRHPQQFFFQIHLWPGCQDCARVHPPRRANEYPEGEVFAYLFDFMDGAEVAFRVYYEDAPLPPKLSTPLPGLIGGRPADLAILNVGNWEQKEVQGSHKTASLLQAREVILGHWEHFFDPSPPATRTLKGLPASPVDPYAALVARELGPGGRKRVHVLAPGVLLNFPR